MRRIALVLCLLAWLPGCAPRMQLFGDGSEALKEYTLRGEGPAKALLVQVRGMIHNEPRRGLLAERPGLVQEIVSRLDMAARDPEVKALILAIDSPGGSVTDSDVLYREIRRYRERSGVKVVALLQGVAASGGYYAAAAADRIVAHPTTITGSIGTVFIRPDLSGLMGKIGVAAEVTKSGRLKDMGSPFRASTAEERELMQRMMEDLTRRFYGVVKESRSLSDQGLAKVVDARVFTADQALELGLVDRVGYLEDALEEGTRLAGLDREPRVVVYRRAEYANDTAYNSLSAGPVVVDLGLDSWLPVPRAGFYYLWIPE